METIDRNHPAETIDELLGRKPFELNEAEKREIFLKAMKQSLKHHYTNCKNFQGFIDSRNFDINSEYKIEDIPFLPVSVFKELELITGDKKDIKKKVLSSSTSGKGSSVFLDSVTINRQRRALLSILSDFIGEKKKLFFVFDSESTIKGDNGQDDKGQISSRASAIRGMSVFAKSMSFLLDKELRLDDGLIRKAISSLSPEDEVCFFGFTWIIYRMLMERGMPDKLEIGNKLDRCDKPKEDGRLEADNKSEKDEKVEKHKKAESGNDCFRKISNRKILLHIGGWKRLERMSVDKQEFNRKAAFFLGIPPSKVMDFYGMTEQLGTVYPDCEYGYKHVPLYSDIIIRDMDSFKPCPKGEMGFIQLLSPIPNSYPGISIISEDIGEIKGEDDCRCGRHGKYFVFRKRAEKAEIKGCGDTYRG